MKDRYRNIDITRNEDNNRIYKSILLPEIKRRLGDTYIIGKSTDRLDLLANKYYGDARLWWIIAEANKLGKGSFAVPAGKQIRIPESPASIEALTNATQNRR
jgi:nucleoid-associated protein YgaU